MHKFYSKDFFSKYSNIISEYSKLIRPELFYCPNGIHGVEHANNVLIFSIALLYVEEEDTDLYLRVLSYASIYHDIGRKFDCNYRSHGTKSWHIIEKKAILLGEAPEIVELVKFLIQYHCYEDGDIIALQDLTNEKLKLIKYFKDADALDRFRIGDFDEKYIRNYGAYEIINFARNQSLRREVYM